MNNFMNVAWAFPRILILQTYDYFQDAYFLII